MLIKIHTHNKIKVKIKSSENYVKAYIKKICFDMSLKLPDITDMRETAVLQFKSGSGKLSSA